MIVTTQTGSIYEIDIDEMKMRRTNKGEDLRRDGEWISMIKEPVIEIGRSMILYLEPLADNCSMTTRFTTTVVGVSDS
jgi:hypothetical protein